MSLLQARRIPLRRLLPRLVKDPYGTLRAVSEEAGGELVRLDLGWFRPYLVTHPDHVQRLLRDNAPNYVRTGMFWNPLSRLFGRGILSDGLPWETSRRNLQPLFTAKRIEALTDRMAEVASEAVERLDTAESLDVSVEMSRIVNRTIIRVFFGDRISAAEAERIIPMLYTIATSMVPRMALPFVPNVVPMPGDRAFRRGVRTVDEVLLPVIRQARERPEGDDVIATLCRSSGVDGAALTEREVRDDAVTMFITATETTSLALTWLWPTLQAHPEVAARLYAEIDRVVGSGPVRGAHVAELRYTRAVLDELLRRYPVGWIFPRTAAAPDVIDGIPVAAGSTLLISPYLTHHLAEFWPRPDVFDPDRPPPTHRYAYFPFGGGPHQCLGRYVFLQEAQIIVASILSRFRPVGSRSEVPSLRVAATLLPAERVHLTLAPVERRLAA